MVRVLYLNGRVIKVIKLVIEHKLDGWKRSCYAILLVIRKTVVLFTWSSAKLKIKEVTTTDAQARADPK